MKMSYDTLGEATLNRLNSLYPPQKDGQHGFLLPEDAEAETGPSPSNRKPMKRDLFRLLRDHALEDEILKRFWTEVNTVPHWVSWEQIERGQEVFYRYGGPALTGLAFQSLLGGMGATRVVETLSRTGGFSTNVARHRLFETTQHILQCTSSLSSIQPGGAGHASSIRVRLLHASVRQRIIRLAQRHKDYYDVEKLGVPINDLDCVATITTFSATLIWLSFPRQGIWLRQKEIEDYLALFRYIAYLTGTPDEYFQTPAKAKAMMETLLRDEIDPSATSQILANNILSCLEGQSPTFPSRPFLEANCRWLNGNELCDKLGIGRPSLYYWMLMAGQVVFFMVICYTYRSIPFLDRRKIAAFRRIIWAVIVEDKHGLGRESTFEFKYIPNLSKSTRATGSTGVVTGKGEVEKRNLRAFVLGCTVICAALWLATKLLWRIIDGFMLVADRLMT